MDDGRHDRVEDAENVARCFDDHEEGTQDGDDEIEVGDAGWLLATNTVIEDQKSSRVNVQRTPHHRHVVGAVVGRRIHDLIRSTVEAVFGAILP